VIQPIAIRIKSVSGQDATGNDELRNLYSMYYDDNTLRRIWRRLMIRDIVVELTAFEPLEPKNFADAKALINDAALKVAGVVNPGQTTFEKAVIPGQEKKAAPAATPEAPAAQQQPPQPPAL
jgi:hypothetical protein